MLRLTCAYININVDKNINFMYINVNVKQKLLKILVKRMAKHCSIKIN